MDSGSAASQKSGAKPYPVANRTYPGAGTTTLATTPPLRQPIRSARTTAHTPPSASKHSASRRSVVASVSSVAKRTKRTRLQARTAQKTWRSPSLPQSMTRCSPGTGTHGRYVRRSRRQAALALATARRRLRAEPSYPADWQIGSRRLALIRPSVARTRFAMSAVSGSVLRGRGDRSAGGRSRRSTTRRTVLWVVPHSAAAARYDPSSSYALGMFNCPLACFTMGVPRGGLVVGLTSPRCRPGGSPGWSDQTRGGDFLVAISGDFLMATRSRRGRSSGQVDGWVVRFGAAHVLCHDSAYLQAKEVSIDAARRRTL